MTNETFKPLINGTEYSWSDIRISIKGVNYAGITAIDYGEAQTITDLYGIGRRPVSRAYGAITATASITLSMATIDALRKCSTTGRLPDIGKFEIIVCFAKENDTKVVTHVLKDCQFKDDKFTGTKEGADLGVKQALITSHIIWNA